MKAHEKLLLENKAWSLEKQQDDPQYFLKMAKDQKPNFLWIGCSDSRVPANEVTNTDPGEMFVHRNIANMVVHTDLNLLSVLQYAVEVLGVNDIIVCGHYGCGGVKAALSHQSLGLIDKWLRNIKDVYRIHRDEIDALPDDDAKTNRLVEFNVQEQVMNLAKTSIIQHAWKHNKRPHLHGWVYGLNDGIIKPVFDMPPNTPIDPIFQYDNI
jgi:carbonic anhydrase